MRVPLVIGGSEWVLCTSNVKLEPELEGNQGICQKRTNTIFINTDETSQAAYPAVRFHEEFHASVWTSGAMVGLQMLTGCSDKKMELVEEYIVSVIGQAMFDTLSRNGCLKYPEVTSQEWNGEVDETASGS